MFKTSLDMKLYYIVVFMIFFLEEKKALLSQVCYFLIKVNYV